MKQYETRTQLIWHFLYGAKRYFIASACCAALVSLFDMISPKIIAFTVDSVIGTKEASLSAPLASLLERFGGAAGLRERLYLPALLVLFAGALAAVFRYLFRANNAKGAETFVMRARNELYAQIEHLPYRWLGENATGDLIQRCTSDVQTIKQFVSGHLTSLVRTVLLIVLAISFMAGIHGRITLLAGLFIPVVVGYSFYFHTRIADAFEKADEEEGRLSTIAQENLTGVRVVRAFGREVYEEDRFRSQNEYYTGFWIHLIRLLSIYWSVGDIIMGLQMLAVVAAGAYYCVNGSLSAGDYIALTSYNLMLIWPVRQLGRVISELSKAGISIDRLRYIMNAEPEEALEDGATPDLSQDIVFDHVSFSFEEGTEVLHDVSFTIPAGKTFGILGGTGSGKSTLMYLLTRLYPLPEGAGTITIGGTDIAKIRTSHLRSGIGMVLQEPFLFSRTLEENIAIAGSGAGHEDVVRAVEAASLTDSIENFSAGYETFVGERGVTLSGGQKQRTAIAQVLVRKPPVMVFDDSLSAVDAETDAKIRRALRENTDQSTVILIAHRITTLMHADHIVVLEKGRIAEEGTHESLLAHGGLYKKIFDLQAAGAEV